MYTIKNCSDCLLVRFNDDFDYNCVQVVIHHLTSLREYSQTNDLWLIGSRRADIHLRDIDSMVEDFHRCCPMGSKNGKTAVVVSVGMTEAVMRIWIDAVSRRAVFGLRVFNTVDEACSWLGIDVPEECYDGLEASTGSAATAEAV